MCVPSERIFTGYYPNDSLSRQLPGQNKKQSGLGNSLGKKVWLKQGEGEENPLNTEKFSTSL